MTIVINVVSIIISILVIIGSLHFRKKLKEEKIKTDKLLESNEELRKWILSNKDRKPFQGTSKDYDRVPIAEKPIFTKQRKPALKAPWSDWKGDPLYEGDVIKHPEGDNEIGIIIYLRDKDIAYDDDLMRWKVKYRGSPVLSSLSLQIGDKGRAVKVKCSELIIKEMIIDHVAEITRANMTDKEIMDAYPDRLSIRNPSLEPKGPNYE